MAPRGTTFGKLERDRAKKAKAVAKRERREERIAPVDGEVAGEVSRLSQNEVLERLTVLHERFDNGAIDFEGFEKEKAALLASLAVE